MNRTIKQPSWLKTGLLLIVGAVLFVLALQYMVQYLLPFMIAIFLALLIDPIVDAGENFGLPRGPIIAVLLLIMVGALVVAGSAGLARLVTELGEIYRDLPLYWDKMTVFVDEVFEVAGRISEALPPPLQQSFDDQWGRLYKGVENLIVRVLGTLRGFPDFLIIFMFSLLSTYFISRDKRQMARFVMGILPLSYRSQFSTIKTEVLIAVLRYVKAQLLLIMLTMLLNIAGLTMLRVNYAVVIGLVAGILDILPLVGPTLIFLPWSIYAFLQGETWLAAGLLLLNVGVSMARHAATVHILRGGSGLHPLTTLLSLYLGIRLLGPVGLIIGPLVAIIAKALFKAGVLSLPHHGGDCPCAK